MKNGTHHPIYAYTEPKCCPKDQGKERSPNLVLSNFQKMQLPFTENLIGSTKNKSLSVIYRTRSPTDISDMVLMLNGKGKRPSLLSIKTFARLAIIHRSNNKLLKKTQYQEW